MKYRAIYVQNDEEVARLDFEMDDDDDANAFAKLHLREHKLGDPALRYIVVYLSDVTDAEKPRYVHATATETPGYVHAD